MSENIAVDIIADFLADFSSNEEIADIQRGEFQKYFKLDASAKKNISMLLLPSHIDGIILCGSSVLDTLVAAKNLFDMYCSDESNSVKRREQPPLIFISGGIGHSTHLLYDAVKNSHYFDLFENDANLPEARIFEKILTKDKNNFNIPQEFVIVEDKSTNCGQNAEFCVPIISEELRRRKQNSSSKHSDNEKKQKNFILLQDPTMQRRSRLSFERHFSLNRKMDDEGEVKIVSVCVPFSQKSLNNHEPSIEIFHQRSLPYDFKTRYVPLLLGEIPRLRNDENGYGPKGKNFIPECEIPERVEKAFEILLKKVEAESDSNNRKL